MREEQVVVFIHGLGDTPDAWDSQIDALPAGFRAVVIDVPALAAVRSRTGQFTLAEASADLLGELDRLGVEKAHFCGLSLGAMIAFRIAVDRPERVHSLTLAAGQVKPPRLLMTLQRAIMRMLPARVVAPQGVSKAYMLAVVDAVAAVDLTGELASVAAPTLVLCGSRDRANLPAARRLASGIPEAELHIIDGAGHQSNVQAPERFSAIFYEFLRRRA